jgi:hypothetical protein
MKLILIRMYVRMYVCISCVAVQLHQYMTPVWMKLILIRMYVRMCSCKADCVWVGRRRSRPRGNPVLSRLKIAFFALYKRGWTGFSLRLENFCGQLKRNQLYTNTYVHTYVSGLVSSLHVTPWSTCNIAKSMYVCMYVCMYACVLKAHREALATLLSRCMCVCMCACMHVCGKLAVKHLQHC